MGVDIITCVQSDNLALVAAFLAAHGAEFVVVGGCALRLHGYDHVPADLDVVPEPSLTNLRRLIDAVDALGTIGRKPRLNDHALPKRDIVTHTTPVGSIDLMLVTGRNEYAALEHDSTWISVNRHAIRVAAIADVLRFRVAFGKPPVRV